LHAFHTLFYLTLQHFLYNYTIIQYLIC